VPAEAFVHVSPFDRTARQRLGFLDHPGKRVPVIRIAGQRLGVEDELAALAAPVGGGDGDLDPELIGLVGFALPDALDFGGMPGIELGAALVLVLRADAHGLAERPGEDRLQPRVPFDLARDIPDQPAEAGAQELQLPVGPLELLGMGVALRHLRRALGEPRIGLPQLEAFRLGLGAQLLDRPQHQLGVGWMGHGLGLDRGVDRDPRQVPELERAARMGHPQRLGQERIELVPDLLAPVADARALVRELMGEELRPGEILEIGAVDPALADLLVRQPAGLLQ